MAEYDAGTVKATMKADSSGLHTAVETAKKNISGLGKEAEEARKQFKELGLSAGIAFGALTAGVLKATQSNNQLKASFMGLDSIAKGTIGTYPKIQAELEKIREDGMIPLSNAISAYKNLLMRYEDEETAIKMFHRLADAAAFGRQGHLSLGEAIQGASEGLKNEMSQMVDNAGVTKNVSVMWKEYAAQIGKTVGQLTDAEKKQAEINGIMQETRFQVGDLAKLQNSLSGVMSKVNALSTEIAAAWGDSLEPAGAGVMSVTAGILSGLREFIKANPAFISGITAGTLALTGITAAGAGWNLVWPKVVAGFGLISGPAGIALIAISALTGVVIGLTTAQQKELEKMKKLSQECKDQTREIYNLTEEYKKLKCNTKLTIDEKERLKKVTEDLANLAPETVKAYDAEGNAILDLNIALQTMVEKKREALELDKKQAEVDLKRAQADLKNLQLAKKNTEEGLQGYLAYNPRNPESKIQKSNQEIAKLNVQIRQKENEIESLRAKLEAIPNEIKNTNVDSIKAEIKAQQDAERKRQEAEAKKAAEAEKLKKIAQDRAKAEEELNNRICELSHSETEVKMREVEKQEAEYRKLGLSEVEIAKWKAGEIARIEEESRQAAREKAMAELEAKRRLQEQALSSFETFLQHEIDMDRATNQEMIDHYRAMAQSEQLTDEQRLEYKRKAELMEKAMQKEQNALMDEWQQKAEDISRTVLERRLAAIEREREASKEAAAEAIQDQIKLKQTMANIDEVYNEQRLQAIVESLNEEYKLKEDMTAEEMKNVKKLLEAKLQALEADATANKEQIEAYKRAIKQISDDIDTETDKINANLKESTADLLTDLITKKTTIEDIWKDLMDELLRQYIKKFIFGIETESGKLTKIFDNIFNGKIFGNSSTSGIVEGGVDDVGRKAMGYGGLLGGIGQIFSGIGSIFGFSGGGLVPAAANGMIVPQLPDSFGTDRILSALTPNEMVLPVDISKFIIDSVRQARNNNNNVKGGDIHFHFNCIDGENAAKFIYDNRDNIVGIIQSNRKNGGVLRSDVD